MRRRRRVCRCRGHLLFASPPEETTTEGTIVRVVVVTAAEPVRGIAGRTGTIVRVVVVTAAEPVRGIAGRKDRTTGPSRERVPSACTAGGVGGASHVHPSAGSPPPPPPPPLLPLLASNAVLAADRPLSGGTHATSARSCRGSASTKKKRSGASRTTKGRASTELS